MHWELVFTIYGDRRGKHKAFDVVVYSGVYEVYAPDEVVLIVKPLDKVAKSLCCIGSEVIDIVKLILLTELIYSDTSRMLPSQRLRSD